MVRVLPSTEIPGLPRLCTALEARQYLGAGQNKWTRIKREIDRVAIDGRDYWTIDALRAYVKRRTRKGVPPEPRPAPPVPSPAKATKPTKLSAAAAKVTPLRRKTERERRVSP
jgi:hypothetical protein